jgi:uncharacterized damage-inducible protein DinB
MRKRIVLTLAAFFAAAPLAAQQTDNDPVGALRRSFIEVSTWAARAADMVPAEKYAYRPAESVRTFGQLVGHLADSFNYYCAQAAGRNVEWSDPVEKEITDKAALVQRLKQAYDTCTPVYTTGGNFRALVDNVGHTSIHYGNIVTYMRMMGLTPPSS